MTNFLFLPSIRDIRDLEKYAYIYTIVQKFKALYLLDKNIDPLHNYFIENINYYFWTYIIQIKFIIETI